MKEDALIHLLQQIKEVLDEHGIEFWLDCGTLLGAVRDGRFIPWEHDIDLGAWHDSVSANMRISVSRKLCDRGLEVWVAQNRLNIKREEAWADVNFYRLNNDKAIIPLLTPINRVGATLEYLVFVLSAPYHYKVNKTARVKDQFIERLIINIGRAMPPLLKKRTAQIAQAVYKKIGAKDVSWVVPSSYFRALSAIRFYGMEFKVPAETEEYLTYRYGKDWQTPRRDWITIKHDGAVVRPRSKLKSYLE